MMKKIAMASGMVFLVICIGIGSMVRFDIPLEKLLPKYSNQYTKNVTIDGTRVYYNDEGAGFPLVLLHGFSSSMQSWDGWNKALSKDFRIIRPDIPGFGLTGPNAQNEYSLRWYAEFFDKFLDALNVKECYLAGNSFGGKLAIECAYGKSSRVKKLILVDASGYLHEGKELISVKLARTPWGRIMFRYITPRFLVAKNLNQAYVNPKMVTSELIDRFYDLIRRKGNRDAFAALCNLPRVDLTEHIKSLKMPTLVMWGNKDPDVPVADAGKFHADITGSELIIYGGTGHLPQEEIPDRSAADAKNFLERSFP